MVSIVFHVDKKTGARYAYKSESYRDPVTKQPRTNQTYLGKEDPITKEIITTNRNENLPNNANKINNCLNNNIGSVNMPNSYIINKEIGSYLLLDSIATKLNILDYLKDSFPNNYLDILSLSYYIAQTGDPLSNSTIWSRKSLHPSNKIYTSQNISKLLSSITNDQCDHFLSLWLQRFINNEYLCYDIASISSYNKKIPFIKRGYNRDKENIPQINLAMLFGQQSKLPAYYRRLPGNITDVKTLLTTVNDFNILGLKNVKLILDRGFYSINNINFLLDRQNSHFTIAVPIRRKWVDNLLDEFFSEVFLPKNHYSLEDDEFIYANTRLYKWGDSTRRLYLHIYYNDKNASEDHNNFILELKNYKDKLNCNFNNTIRSDYYDKYLIIKQYNNKGLSIKYNNDEILKYRNRYAGCFCILSTFIKDPIETLHVYRHKDVVEKSFDDIKNELDLKRLRIHNSTRMDAKLFIYFISLILISEIRNISKTEIGLKKYSAQYLINYMSILEHSKREGSYKTYYTEADNLHKEICKIFNLNYPS
jgi:transposase